MLSSLSVLSRRSTTRQRVTSNKHADTHMSGGFPPHVTPIYWLRKLVRTGRGLREGVKTGPGVWIIMCHSSSRSKERSMRRIERHNTPCPHSQPPLYSTLPPPPCLSSFPIVSRIRLLSTFVQGDGLTLRRTLSLIYSPCSFIDPITGI